MNDCCIVRSSLAPASRHDQQRKYAPMRCAEESVDESVLLLAKFESCSVIDLYDLLLARSSVVFQVSAYAFIRDAFVKPSIIVGHSEASASLRMFENYC